MIGSLCSGIGGLEEGVHRATGLHVAWHAEYDPDASKVLARHYPDTPNLGDITKVDWAAVEPVDILTAGYPCQPFSLAGLRKGTDDVRHLWPFVADAIRVLRPRYALFENVAGHISLGFDTVLADLASLGFDAEWATFRASDVGAPHKRERLFILAADPGDGGWDRRAPGRTARLEGEYCNQAFRRQGISVAAGSPRPAPDSDSGCATVGTEPVPVSGRGSAVVAGLDRQTPTDADGGRCEVGPELDGDTPQDAANGHPCRRHAHGRPRPHMGRYEGAVRRWEAIHGPAPHPLHDGRLNPNFVEWMQGYPQDWTAGLSKNARLRCVGNAVVPQVAELAWKTLTATNPTTN